jgi:hypothetical protein
MPRKAKRKRKGTLYDGGEGIANRCKNCGALHGYHRAKDDCCPIVKGKTAYNPATGRRWGWSDSRP